MERTQILCCDTKLTVCLLRDITSVLRMAYSLKDELE